MVTGKGTGYVLSTSANCIVGFPSIAYNESLSSALQIVGLVTVPQDPMTDYNPSDLLSNNHSDPVLSISH